MGKRRFEMYQYRQVIYSMRRGQSDRAIAQARLMCRAKCAIVRAIAQDKGWLADVPIPDDNALVAAFAPQPVVNL